MPSIFAFLVVLLVPVIATIAVYTFYKKNLNINVRSGVSGFEVARYILDSNGLDNMYIVEIKKTLKDNYDCKQKVLRLSTNVFHGSSYASLAIASLYAYHAVLDKKRYSLISVQRLLEEFIKFLVYVAYIMYIIGILLQGNIYVYACGFLFICIIYYLILLPIEIVSKDSTLELLKKSNMVMDDELENIQNINNVFIFLPLAQIILCLIDLKDLFSKK